MYIRLPGLQSIIFGAFTDAQVAPAQRMKFLLSIASQSAMAAVCSRRTRQPSFAAPDSDPLHSRRPGKSHFCVPVL